MADDKQRTFLGLEFRVAVWKDSSKQTVVVKWDDTKFANILTTAYKLAIADKTHKDRRQWLIYLDEYHSDDEYHWGCFSHARYGTKSEKLIDSVTLQEHDNDRPKERGEKNRTHFLVRRSDGFMLLESGMWEVATRPTVMHYLDTFGSVQNCGVEYTLISALYGKELLEALLDLSRIGAVSIEYYTEKVSGVNPAYQGLLGAAIEHDARTFQFGLRDNRRAGLNPRKIEKWIRSMTTGQGIKSLRVIGAQDKVRKVLTLERVSERYRPTVEFDENGHVKTDAVYDVMKMIAKERAQLPVEEVESVHVQTKAVDDDE